MRPINQKARAVMDTLTRNLWNIGDHDRIDNAPGAFMYVAVEMIEQNESGELISVAHYYEQNGDLMRDPEMIFLHAKDGNYYPTYFRQDGGLPIEQNSVEFYHGGKRVRYSKSLQKDHAIFAGTWMRNIKEQQGL
jgi:hypothetical protein